MWQLVYARQHFWKSCRAIAGPHANIKHDIILPQPLTQEATFSDTSKPPFSQSQWAGNELSEAANKESAEPSSLLSLTEKK
jgi:hypothetical protein